jgi:hypothetical protein
MLFINRLEFACFADFFVRIFKTREEYGMVFFKIRQLNRDCEWQTRSQGALSTVEYGVSIPLDSGSDHLIQIQIQVQAL